MEPFNADSDEVSAWELKGLLRNPKLGFTAASDLVCLFCDFPASFSVGTRFLVRFALEISGPLARLLRFGTYCFMGRSAIADFPEGATHVCARAVTVGARCTVQGPAICEHLGGGDHTLTRELQLVLKTVLVFLGPVVVKRPHG